MAALSRINDRRAVEPLVRCLHDPDEMCRIGAAEVLGKLGDTRAVEPLRQAQNDPLSPVREAAERSLRRLSRK
ncbi:MAG: HEAT repeat domain-containing protein [Methanoregula sp.]|nr:HEAT repeat domain-containing protein [Methanoregula sp.]